MLIGTPLPVEIKCIATNFRGQTVQRPWLPGFDFAGHQAAHAARMSRVQEPDRNLIAGATSLREAGGAWRTSVVI